LAGWLLVWMTVYGCMNGWQCCCMACSLYEYLADSKYGRMPAWLDVHFMAVCPYSWLSLMLYVWLPIRLYGLSFLPCCMAVFLDLWLAGSVTACLATCLSRSLSCCLATRLPVWLAGWLYTYVRVIGLPSPQQRF
jgi:hypothetical protein